MKREPRYTVLKNTDAEKHLDGDEISLLVALCDKVTLGRYRDGKPALQCVVIESDWPEYEPTWAAIERRVRQEQCAHDWTAVVAGDPTWCMKCGASGPIAD